MITVSIINHNHKEYINNLISTLLNFSEISKIIITNNSGEDLELEVSPKIFIISNEKKKGFGLNHNNAFCFCDTKFFCVMNPDIILKSNPFPTLLEELDNNTGVVAPLVKNKDLIIEDTARNFPTLTSLIKKLIVGISDKDFRLESNLIKFNPEWIAGMFLLFTKHNFNKVNGFDTNFFLYYEDVDISRRLRKLGLLPKLVLTAEIIHDAQRSSHKNFKFMIFHAKSILIYFLKCIQRKYN